MNIRSQLSRYQLNGIDPQEKRAMQIEAWRQQPDERTLHISPEDFKRLTPIEYQVAVRIGNRLFGGVINGR